MCAVCIYRCTASLHVLALCAPSMMFGSVLWEADGPGCRLRGHINEPQPMIHGGENKCTLKGPRLID